MNDASLNSGTDPQTTQPIKHSRFSRLLLVEDNQGLLFTLQGILEEEGFAVTGCLTAAEALQKIRHQEYDVAVLDLHLPDMLGVQLLKEIRKLGRNVRVIINTAFGAFESAKDAINLGAFAYVEKASDPGDLVRQVHRASRSHFERYADGLEAAVVERTAKLSESKKQLRLLFDNAPVCLWHEDYSNVNRYMKEQSRAGVLNFREFFETHPQEVVTCAGMTKVLDANIAAIELLNAKDRDELTASRTAYEDSLRVFQNILISLADGQQSFESDTAIRTLDGQNKDVMLRMFVDPSAPNWSSVYVALTDITERRQIEQAHKMVQHQLRHSQKMDAVGQLAAGVAHEFNNLLVAILVNTELMLAETEPPLPTGMSHFLLERKGGLTFIKLPTIGCGGKRARRI